MPLKKEQPAKKSLLGRILAGLALVLLLIVSALGIGTYLFLSELHKELPNIDQLRNIQYQIPLSIYSNDNLLIAQFGEKKRIPIGIEAIPKQQIAAFIAAEDERFYTHPGVDYKGLARAALQLAMTGKKRQGGSTITMQVTRNFLLSNEKTYLRKLKEIMLALKIEKAFSKNEILELYLNKIYLGHRSYGVAAAAETYYGKPLKELNLGQQAMIAGLPKAPSVFNPISDPDRALKRRNYVLRRMLDLGFITPEQFSDAVNKQDNAAIENKQMDLSALYVAEMARQEMVARYGEDAYTMGIKVYTTITGNLQAASDNALRATLHEYEHRHGNSGLNGIIKNTPNTVKNDAIGDTRLATILSWSGTLLNAKLSDNSTISLTIDDPSTSKSLQSKLRPNSTIRVRKLENGTWHPAQVPRVEGAFVALNAHTGAILALSGGFDFTQSKYNRATQSKRQPGSGFKPFIYTAALEKGYTLASVINDAPIVIEDPSQENDWRPENYTRRFVGPTPLRVALRESINLVSVRLLQDIGIPSAIATAMRFGFDQEQLPPSLSLALGSGHATPLKMASAYAVFANGGFLIQPYLIDRIENHNGETLFKAQPPLACNDCPDQAHIAPLVLSPQINFLMNSVLRDVVQRGTAAMAKELGRNDLAGKTGTTNEQRDAWFNGYAGGVVASAWVGYDDSSPLGKGETGGKAALPMWMAFMRTALKDIAEKELEPPPGIIKAYISQANGLLAESGSKSGIWEYFSEGTAPTRHASAESSDTEQEEYNEAESLF